MRLSFANLGAIFTGLARVFRELFDAINAHGVSGREPAEHDCGHGTCIRASHKKSTHCTGSVVRTKASSEQILHADLIGSLLTCSVEEFSSHVGFCSAFATACVLKKVNSFAHFAAHKVELNKALVQVFYNAPGELAFMIAHEIGQQA